MKLSKRKRRIIIKLAEESLSKNHNDESLNRNLRSIITRMKDSIIDTDSVKGKIIMMYNVKIYFRKPHIPCQEIIEIEAESPEDAFKIALNECGNLPYFKSRTEIKEVDYV